MTSRATHDSKATTTADPVFAALDLGSNSFHMMLARWTHGEFRVIDRMRERVRMAAGLDADLNLTAESRERGLACLHRFAERVRNLPPGYVRAVGTNTFRRARNGRAFLNRAEEELGHPVEIISGHEEARLVYLGVTSSSPPVSGRRLVVDIGGGSTECIVGDDRELLEAESRYMGCVSYSQRFFASGKLDRRAFDLAVIAAQVELQGLVARFDYAPGTPCLGASGTIHAIQRVANGAGWGAPLSGATLRHLRKELVSAGHIDAVDLPALGSERKPVLPGGLAILLAIFKSFNLESMTAAPGGVREGLLYDLQGRHLQEDVRHRTIRSFMSRFQVDEAQSMRVERTAIHLYEEVRQVWKIEDIDAARVLSWAARLHEVGLAISHSGYHRHSAYLVLNSDMPGFSRDGQRLLSALIRSHRRRIDTTLFEDIPHVGPKYALRACAIFRLATLMHRTRGARALPAFAATASKNRVTVDFPEGWLAEHPLTRTDLDKEAAQLEAAGLELTFS